MNLEQARTLDKKVFHEPADSLKFDTRNFIEGEQEESMVRKLLVVFYVFVAAAAFSAHAQAHSPLTPTRFISYQGLDLAVYESSGRKGPGVLLVHGNTSSAPSYARTLNSDFARRNRLVAIDLPGFGRSDDAPSYDAAFLAGAIVRAVKVLNLDRGVIVGWSLGGDLALQASTQLPQIRGYFLFGTAPIGHAPELPPPFLSPQESFAGAAVQFGAVANLTPEQINQYVTAFFAPTFRPIPQFFFEEGQRTDPGTRTAVFNAVTGQDPTFQDEVAIVRSLRLPIALLLADTDAFLRPAYLQGLASSIPTLWRHRIVIVNNSGHASHWEKPNRFLNLLQGFIRDL